VRVLPAILLLAACATTPAPPAPTEGPREVLLRFLAAVDGGDMEGAYRLLSGRWRARLTPERLRRDLREGGEAAVDRLDRARAAAKTRPVVEGEVAAFPVGEGLSVRLHREADGWKVDSLE
jgi:hypothetical protein